MSNELISLFVPNLQAGGVERMRVNLANEFVEKGHDVDLVLSKAVGQFIESVDKRVNIVNLDVTSPHRIQLSFSLIKLSSYIRRRNPDIFLSSMKHVNVVSILAWKMSSSDTKMWVSEHNPPSENLTIKSSLVNKMASVTYEWSDQIIAVSNGVKRDMSETYGINRDEIGVIYNPVVDAKIFELMKEETNNRWIDNPNIHVVLGVGRFHQQKDFDTLVRSFSRIEKANDKTRLLLLGDGNRREHLEELVSELGLREKVAFLGFVENPYKYMHRSSVFVLSSQWEGFGNVIVEALACGCPVVSTDCPGPSEILCGGKFGRIVPVGDVEELSKAVLKTIGESYDSADLQQRADDFKVEKVVDSYAEMV